MAWAFFACLAISVMLSEIMSAAAACAYKDISRAARARVTPRLTLATEGFFFFFFIMKVVYSLCTTNTLSVLINETHRVAMR